MKNWFISNKNTTDNYIKTFDYLMTKKPIIKVKEVQEMLGISYQGANKIIDSFVNLGILKEENPNKRNRLFVFNEYYNLLLKSQEE